MLVVLPAAVLFAAAELKQGFVAPSLARLDQRWVRLTLTGSRLAAVLALNLRAYFVDFAGQCRYGGDRATRFASYLGSYLNTIDPEATVYWLSDNELQYGTHSSVESLSGNRPVMNWTAPVGQLKLSAQLSCWPDQPERKSYVGGRPRKRAVIWFRSLTAPSQCCWPASPYRCLEGRTPNHAVGTLQT
jgi:hypothetical protein